MTISQSAYRLANGIWVGLAVLCLALSAASAQGKVGRDECVRPGSVVTITNSGIFTSGHDTNLFFAPLASGPRIYVKILSATSSRLRFLMPQVGVPKQTELILYQQLKNEDRVRRVAKITVCGPSNGGSNAMAGSGPSGGAGADPAPGGIGGSGGSGTGLLTLSGPLAGPSGGVATERATRDDVAAPSGAPETILMGSSAHISRAEAIARSSGASILRSFDLGSLGLASITVDLNGTTSVGQFRALLARRGLNVSVGRHQVYEAAQGLPVYAPQMVGLVPIGNCEVPRNVRIGLIDGPVDVRNPALRGVDIETASVLGRRARNGSSQHATAIAGLIAAPETGLAPGVSIISVTAFSRAGFRDVATLENIAKALDLLIKRGASIVNLSLAGPRNEALERVIVEAARRNVIMVAAAGNEAQAAVAYPAAHPRVIAVTAVDAAKRLYRNASRGSAVDFAAPGVDLAVPGRGGFRTETGTSFAAAVTTAIIAHEVARGPTTQAAIIRSLSRRAEDLGPVGRDPEFGHGLIRAAGC